MTHRREHIVPADHQPALPRERFIVEAAPGPDALELDVLIVGAGPAGLAAAITVAQLSAEAGGAPLSVGVLEKAATLGGHCLSGAVIDAGPLRELCPDVPEDELPLRGPAPRDRVYLLSERRAWRIPTPPTMRNRGNHLASICELVRWLGRRAEDAGVDVMPGYPAASLLVRGDAVVGVRTVASGLDRDGAPGPDHEPPADLKARVVVLAEGTRGALAQAWMEWQGISSPNPQIYALGVKELWQVRRRPDAIVHTMGWPLPRDCFGGSFLYPMGEDLAALGIVVGLDHRAHALDAHALLQELKGHPLLARVLEGGALLEWGAKTIPEGGWWSLPERLSGDGVLVAGDAAGLVDVASLKGIHYAMRSGMLAGRTIVRFLGGEVPLRHYDEALRLGFITRDLHRRRNMRLAFKKGFVRGGLGAAVMTLTGGRFPGRRIPVVADARVQREIGPPVPAGSDGRTLSKPDAVFRADNATRDDIPSHLTVPERIPPALGEMYERMCPAGVYEWRDGTLVVNAPNCIDCKATDVLGPRWHPREGGSGPSYKRM